MSPDDARLVEFAQAFDHAHRPAGQGWQRVPDEQVLRLLTGARISARVTGSRPCTIADQIRWAAEWIRETYGPGSKYAREHSSE